MPFKERILQDLNIAIKGKKELETLVLRQLSAAFLNKEKEKRYRIFKEKSKEKTELVKETKVSSPAFANARLTDEEMVEVISFEAKKRKEAILEFEKGKRQDLVEKEKKELVILQKYLPEQLSEEEIKKLAKEVIKKVGAKEQKDIGKVMAEMMPQVKDKADGGLVSKTVKELLIGR